MSRRLLTASLLLLASCAGASPRVERPATAEAAPRLRDNAIALHTRFMTERAMETVADLDGHFRVRGNAGYQAALVRVVADLTRAGAGAFSPELIATLELGEVRDSWTPRSASLVLLSADGTEVPLVTFASEADPDRASLLVNSDSLPETTFEVVTLEQVRAGTPAAGRLVLSTEAPTPTFEEVVRQDAAGVIVHWLHAYHRVEEHPDAAQFGYLPDVRGTHVGFSIDAEAHAALTRALEHGPARVRVTVDVERAPSAATAVEAHIPGTDETLPAIVFVAHVDEPGANDNASGVAALVGLARVILHAMDEGAIEQPARTIAFVWGQEIEVADTWLSTGRLPVGAGLVFDMVGSDPEATGASFLIERTPDPGAVWLRAPDVHSEWGAGEITEDQLHGHFLNDLTIAAATAVAEHDGPWTFRSHPFEGGSDHVAFLGRSLPGILAWHFTDDAYHTTRDRLARVSGPEIRRVVATMGAVALSMASTDLADRREILAIVEAAAHQRLAAALAAARGMLDGGGDLATERHVIEAWGRWYADALMSVDQWGLRQEALHEEVRAAQDRVATEYREAAAALTL